jgi:hypothetical protein
MTYGDIIGEFYFKYLKLLTNIKDEDKTGVIGAINKLKNVDEAL